MMTMPTSATPKHMPTPINRTTSTARIASSRAAILIRLMAPNDTPNNTAVPGFFMVQQDYHTVRYPPCESAWFWHCWPDSPSLTSPHACPRRPNGKKAHISAAIARALQEPHLRLGRLQTRVDCCRMAQVIRTQVTTCARLALLCL